MHSSYLRNSVLTVSCSYLEIVKILWQMLFLSSSRVWEFVLCSLSLKLPQKKSHKSLCLLRNGSLGNCHQNLVWHLAEVVYMG